MIEQEARILNANEPAYDRVFVGGFSEGAMMTLSMLMQQHEFNKNLLAGYVSFSGMVPVNPSKVGRCKSHPWSFVPLPTGE